MSLAVGELIALNPYPGLRPFAQAESGLFFGREQQITDLAARLAETPLVAVSGTSGCGKSSLVLAGLLNHLAQRRAAGGGVEWRPVVLRPGNRPIANLAEKLAEVLHAEQDDAAERAGPLYGMLRLGGLGLVEAVRVAQLDPQVRILVVVDQFEEIFRFKRMTDPDEATAFVKLLNAAREPTSAVSVILTLRSDALGDCAEFRDLPEAINQGLYLVPRLTREQRKDAIVKPAELRGQEIAKPLVQRVINDVSDDFNDLPVMQHALTRTWQFWAQACRGARPLDLEDYENEKVGGAKHALSNHADEAYHSLRGLENVTEKVFRALTERVGDGIENRRPLEFERLCQVVGGGGKSGDQVPAEVRARVAEVVERFRRPDTPFLMPPAAKELKDDPVIDITHESLIRLWQRLREWAQAESESSAMLLWLVEAARQGDLLPKRNLERALEWQRKVGPTPAWVNLYTQGDGVADWESVQQFLIRSTEEDQRQQWRRRRLVWGVRVLGLAVLAVSLAAAVVLWQHQLKTLSAQFATQALLEFNRDPAGSAQWAMEAVELDPENERAAFALRQSMATLDVVRVERIEEMDAPIADIRLSPDGSVLVAAAGKQVTLFDAQSWQRETPPIEREQKVAQAWLLVGNQVLLTLTDEGSAQTQRMSGDSTVHEIACEHSSIYKLATSVDDERIAVACVDGELSLWNLAQAEPRVEKRLIHSRGPTGSIVTALAFSGDGEYLAAGSAHGVVSIWKRGQVRPWIGTEDLTNGKSPIGHERAVRDISFHPLDANWLVTASDDKTAVVWRLDLDGHRLAPAIDDSVNRWPLVHPRPVSFASFTNLPFNEARDGHPPVATAADKAVRFWSDGREFGPRSGHENWIMAVSHSASGIPRTLTASSDGTARMWASESASPLAVLSGHRGVVVRALFTRQDDQVVTASEDGALRVWRVKPPAPVALFRSGWILSAAFEPSGARIAVGAEGGQAALFDLEEQGDLGMVPLESPFWKDAISDLSWERNGKFLAARLWSYDISNAQSPILWSTETGKVLSPKWEKRMLAASFGAGTDELLTVSSNGELAVWNTTTLLDAAPQPEIIGTQRDTWTGTISPDGRWIATIGGPQGSGTVTLWDRHERPTAPRQLLGHKGTVTSVRFSPDSTRLVSSSFDRTARIWYVETPERWIELTGHTQGLTSATFSQDGKQVATASLDRTVRVWDADTGRELAALYWHGEGVNDVQFSRDGAILSASDDGVVRLGTCDSCSLQLDDLRKRAEVDVVLREIEWKDIRDEIATAGWAGRIARFWSQPWPRGVQAGTRPR